VRRQLSICFVSQEYPEETGWGGIGTYTYELAHGLARLGHRVCVLSRALDQERMELESDGVNVYRVLPRLNPSRLPVLWRLNRVWEGYHLAVALKLCQVIREQAVDIIETPALHGETILFQYWQRSFPVVVRIHSCSQQTMALNGVSQRLPLRISHWCERQTVSLAHHLTAPSRAIVQDNLAYLPIQRGELVKVIPNPVDVERFCPAGNRLPADKPIVLFVGRLQQLKGAHILAQAIPLVWQDHPEAHFIFVGRDGQSPDGGSMAQWILEQASPARQSQIKFISHLSHQLLVTLYQHASLVVLPSFRESFSYVCIEAMACGKPVIATHSGGPEEIIDDGKTGFLISPGNVELLAEKIKMVLNRDYLLQKVGQAARKKAETTYDTRIIARQVADFYQSVVDK
jgi:glycosyltransferase involved in cell wall biosynthesis